MNISLDYDETITLDKAFWGDFTSSAIKRGHKVYIVTYRHGELDYHKDFDFLKRMGADLIFTNGIAKKPLLEKQGIKIDVWVDDRPKVVYEHSTLTEDGVKEWRKTRPGFHKCKDKDFDKLEKKSFEEFNQMVTELAA